MGNKRTVMSRDGQWKAELHAFKDNWLVYARIGSECKLFHRQKKKWVRRDAAISIVNTYKGGGLQITRQGANNGSYAALFEFAYGFIGIDIKIDTGEVGPSGGTAKLIINSVDAEISVQVPGDRLTGKVSADTAIVQQSTW